MSCDVMTSGDCSEFDSQPTSLQSTGGLGYSRHYAQRIRDLGQTSKDSWIKRLWNHMFGSSSANNKKLVVQSEDVSCGGSGSGTSCKRAGDHSDDRSLLTDRTVSSHGHMSEFNDVKKLHHGSSTDKHDIATPLMQRQTRSTNELSGRNASMPPHLINSPYLPAREKVVYYRPVLTAKPTNSSKNDGITAAKLRFERLTKSSTALRSSPGHAVDMSDLHKSRSLFPVRRQFKRDSATLQMEKRAKAVADRAIMVCTCDLFV